MALTYKTLAGKPQIFLRLTGVSIHDFQEIIKKVIPEWEQKILLKKKCDGRTSKLKTLNVTLPFRGSKKHPLTLEQKKHNKGLASFRAKVEHKFRELKIFKILRDVYRNFQKKHNMRFNIIAGIVNLKCGF